MQDDLATIVANYVRSLPARLREITIAWEHLKHVSWDAQRLDTMIQEAHKLAGSAGTFQFPEISRTAKELENTLISFKETPGSDAPKAVAYLLDQLASAIRQAANVTPDPSPAEAKTGDEGVKRACIAVVDDDTDQAALVTTWLSGLGHEVHRFESPDQLSTSGNVRPFDVIVLDIQFPGAPSAGLIWTETLGRTLMPDAHVIITSSRTDLSARLRALRAGADAYFGKPLPLETLSSAIEDLINKQPTEALRVLCVDDDNDVLKHHESTLSAQGFEVQVLNEPRKILHRLEHFNPHALLLDHKMPGLSGAELSGMLRHDPRYQTLPIVFVSSFSEELKQDAKISIRTSAIFPKGADPAELARVLRGEIAESRALSVKVDQTSQRSAASGLSNPAFFITELESLLQDSAAAEHHTLIQVNLDRLDYLLEAHGRRALVLLGVQISRFLAQHPCVVDGCAIGDGGFLVLIRTFDGNTPRAMVETLYQDAVQAGWHIESTEVGLSFGAVQLSARQKPDLVLGQAEKASEEGLSQGGERIVWHQEAGPSSNCEQHEIIKRLLKQRRFSLAYQATVNIEDTALLYEASLRLEDEEGRIYSPIEFLPKLASTLEDGEYQLDRWMLEQVVSSLGTLGEPEQERGTAVIRPFSTPQSCQRLLPHLSHFMTEQRIRGHKRVLFAFTESELLQNLESTRRLIVDLAAIHCGFMITDAGSTAFSVQLMQDLAAADFVKLSISLGAKGFGREARRKTVQNLLTHLKPGAHLIAAGIEDAAVMAEFSHMGIEYFQGYFIQRPDTAMRRGER